MLLTDHAWPDCEIERALIEEAGFAFVAGPATAGAADAIDALVREHDPVAILTCWAPVSHRAIASPSHLKIVARMGVGLDNIAVDAATARGVHVTNVPDYCTEEVSDHAVALLLAGLRDVPALDRDVKSGAWRPAAARTKRLRLLTIALIGFGRIGQATARKLSGFGCAILAVARRDRADPPGVRMVDLATVQAEADVIILHAPLTGETRGLINEEFLRLCAKTPWLINVSRGGLVDNDALIRALESGVLAGAALDVVEGEPAPPAALVGRPDVIVTPHVGFFSPSSLNELRRRSAEEVVRVLRGAPPHYPCNTVKVATRPLSGGVASDIYVTDTIDGAVVVKAALAKLRVEAEWLSDTSRSLVEADALAVIADLLGAKVAPRVLWIDREKHCFGMELADPRLRNWKRDLLDGPIDLATASQAGTLLGRLHTCAAKRSDIAARFADVRFFEELRVRPYFETIAGRNPDLRPFIQRAVDGMRTAEFKSLVHGDFSPKNILADGADVMILDCEVAHWGDPRFDLAFCLSHLLLKAARRPQDADRLEAAADALMQAYRREGPPICDAALTRLVGCLVLARLEGDSRVDYLHELDAGAVKAWATKAIREPGDALDWQLRAGAAA